MRIENLGVLRMTPTVDKHTPSWRIYAPIPPPHPSPEREREWLVNDC